MGFLLFPVCTVLGTSDADVYTFILYDWFTVP